MSEGHTTVPLAALNLAAGLFRIIFLCFCGKAPEQIKEMDEGSSTRFLDTKRTVVPARGHPPPSLAMKALPVRPAQLTPQCD